MDDDPDDCDEAIDALKDALADTLAGVIDAWRDRLARCAEAALHPDGADPDE